MIKLEKTILPLILALGVSTVAVAQEHDQTTTTTTEESHRDSRISPGGLFIEPILNAVREDSTIKTSQLPIITDNSSGKAEGYGLGLRLGVHVSEIVFLGVDGRYNREQLKDSFYNTADADVYNWGPTLGFQTPYFGLRLMGTYIAGGEFNPGPGVQGLDLKFTNARGYRAGVGLHVASVSVNLEYQDINYDNTVIESLGSIAVNGTTHVDSNTKGYALSLSFPVEL